MSYKISITPEAQEELQEAFEYFEEQQVGLGQRLLFVLKKQIDLISAQPEIAQEIRPNRRRAVLRPFQYNLIYTVDHDSQSVLIVVVMHGSRDPERWEKR